MKAKLLHALAVLRTNYNEPGVVDIFIHGANRRGYPVGHVIDHPDAYILVRNGDAEAVDDECIAAAGCTVNRAAVAAQKQLTKDYVDLVDESRSEGIEDNE